MITVLNKRIRVTPGNPPAYVAEVKINDSDEIMYINIINRLRTEYMVSDISMIECIDKTPDKPMEEIKFYEMFGTYDDTQKFSKYAGLFKSAYNAILYFSKQEKLIEIPD